jgi:hypothetical protein
LKTDFWFFLLSAASVAILVSQWWIYRRLTRRMGELKNLINELGSMVGEWIDGQTK